MPAVIRFLILAASTIGVLSALSLLAGSIAQVIRHERETW